MCVQIPQGVSFGRAGLASLNISTDRIAATFFWNRFVKEKRRVLFFSPDRVCKLHQQNQCKYGVECKNVHLCREIWSQVFLLHPLGVAQLVIASTPIKVSACTLEQLL